MPHKHGLQENVSGGKEINIFSVVFDKTSIPLVSCLLVLALLVLACLRCASRWLSVMLYPTRGRGVIIVNYS